MTQLWLLVIGYYMHHWSQGYDMVGQSGHSQHGMIMTDIGKGVSNFGYDIAITACICFIWYYCTILTIASFWVWYYYQMCAIKMKVSDIHCIDLPVCCWPFLFSWIAPLLTSVSLQTAQKWLIFPQPQHIFLHARHHLGGWLHPQHFPHLWLLGCWFVVLLF